MNNPVSFQLAKLLKEKGFNNSTNLMYSSNGILTDKVYDFDDWCFAPTIAEVVMWLYEEHKIWMYCEIFKDKFYTKAKKLRSKWRRVVSGIKDNENILYSSPKEAYEAGIKYVLEKIITDNS